MGVGGSTYLRTVKSFFFLTCQRSAKRSPQERNTHLDGDIVVYSQDDKLDGNVCDTDIVENVWVLKWNLSGHWNELSASPKRNGNSIYAHCMAPREMTKFCTPPDMFEPRKGGTGMNE
jgi:hypothetical protein